MPCNQAYKQALRGLAAGNYDGLDHIGPCISVHCTANKPLTVLQQHMK